MIVPVQPIQNTTELNRAEWEGIKNNPEMIRDYFAGIIEDYTTRGDVAEGLGEDLRKMLPKGFGKDFYLAAVIVSNMIANVVQEGGNLDDVLAFATATGYASAVEHGSAGE